MGLKEYFKRIKWESLITALIAIVMGIVFIATPQSSGNALCVTAGIIFIVFGAVLLTRFLVYGLMYGSDLLIYSILLLTVGILCLVRPTFVQGIITVIFGLFLIIDGILKIQTGINCMQARAKGAWTLFLVAGLSIVLGVIVMLGTFEDVMLFAGISLIIDGICDVITTLTFSAHVKSAERHIIDLINSDINSEE